jgi:hypothetical protein
MKYPALPGKQGLTHLDNLLLHQSYVTSHSTPGLPDLQVFLCLAGCKDVEGYDNVARWQRNIKSYESEFSTWEKPKVGGESKADVTGTKECCSIIIFENFCLPS